ncbi:unnamed protein product, partial [Thlaspi arvense]
FCCFFVSHSSPSLAQGVAIEVELGAQIAITNKRLSCVDSIDGKIDVINLNDENILSDIEMDHANDLMDEDLDHHEANPVESLKLKKDEQEEEKDEEKDKEIEEEKEEEKEES